jgi:hypothetical protein
MKDSLKTFIFLNITPLIIVASFSILSIQNDLRLSIPLLIGLTAIIVILLSFITFYGENHQIKWSSTFIILVALLIRLLFVFRQPELSDDIFRYLWDGMQLLNGNNPYSIPPDSVTIINKNLVNIKIKINHPQLVTIYPPAAQILFVMGVLLGKTIFGIKLLLVILDIFSCFIIIKILKIFDMSTWKSVIYAWNPLPVLEVAGSGHIDAAALFFLLVTILILFLKLNIKEVDNLKIFAAGITFGCSFLVKLIPIIFLPLCIIVLKKRGRLFFISGFVFIIIFLSYLFYPELFNMFKTLAIYIKNWEFSNCAFRFLRRLFSSGNIARLILFSLFFILNIALTLHLKRNISKFYFIKTTYLIAFIFLLLNPTLHPWYVLYLVVFLPLYTKPEGIVFGWVIFLSYYVQIEYFLNKNWIENDLISAVIWVSPILSLLISRLIYFIKLFPSHSLTKYNP